MNYTLMPSLEHRALVRIAITLWNQDDARDLLSEFYLSSLYFSDSKRQSEWQAKDKVIKKVVKVPLLIPDLLKMKLSSILGPIGWQILMWQECHKHLFGACSLRQNVSKLCWTPQGTVDMKKTAEVLLVRNESLSITNRYIFACIYCLEDDIYTLWEQLSGNEPYGKDLNMIGRHEPSLVSFWSLYIEGEIAQLDNRTERYCETDITPYGFLFQYSAQSGNEAATRYFLQKLTPEENERILVKTAQDVAKGEFYLQRSGFYDFYEIARHGFTSQLALGREITRFRDEHCTDVLCFLLSSMDKEQQIKVFKSNPNRVLRCFLDWPWQSFFMEVAKHTLTFLTESDYHSLLLHIVSKKVVTVCEDYNYRELFGEFWQQSPTTHKRYVIDECASGYLLAELFRIGDKKNIKLIFNDATLTQKKNLIFCDREHEICRNLFYADKWDLLQFLIQECISSKNEMIEFKEEFQKTVTRYFSKQTYAVWKDKWDNFFQSLGDS